eukprot:10358059-Lingulodinium_polyedra.AAC.1
MRDPTPIGHGDDALESASDTATERVGNCNPLEGGPASPCDPANGPTAAALTLPCVEYDGLTNSQII